MRRLGISVYPEHSTPEADRAYLELAASYGFTRIFTCLLSVEKGAAETIEEFGSFITFAHDLGFLVAVDTNETVFERLGATPFDIAPFAQMGVDIIRLDSHFGDRGNMMLTRNPYGIAIEFNASHNHPLANLIERGADVRNMVACHNFYPEPYTGLSEEYFQRYSAIYKDLGMPLAAFVSSQQPNTFGPWPVFAGLPTCEDDRHRPIDLQLRHLIAGGLVDDVIVGNCFASEAELASLASVDLTRVRTRIVLDEGISADEHAIVFDFEHAARHDPSPYMIRSSWSRSSFRERPIAPRAFAGEAFTRGDVLVVNDNMAHYRGEIQVALRDIPNDGTRNRVGRIPEEEQFLLDYILPEHPFGFMA